MKESKFDKIVTKVMMFCWKHKFAIGLGTAMIGAYCLGIPRQERLAQYKAEQEAYYNDPANQLSSGGVVVDDAWDEGDGVANLTINNVPIESMGDFGEALIERLRTNPGLMEQQDVNDILDHNPQCSLLICLYPNKEEEKNTNEENSTDPEPVANDDSADGVQGN